MFRQVVINKRHIPRQPQHYIIPLEIRHGILPKFSSANVEGLPTPEDLEELLACCTNCGRIPPPNSYICATGHMTCVECFRDSTTEGCSFALTNGLHPPTKTEFGIILPHCSKPLRKRPCFVYNEIYNNTQIACPNQPCEQFYYGKDVSKHQLTCVGSKNLSCPESECSVPEKWTQESLLTHLMEHHGVRMTICAQKLFKVEPWWFASAAQRVTLMMKNGSTVWIGVAMKEVVDGRDACVFILYQVSNQDRNMDDPYKFRTKYEANLSFRMGKTDHGPVWSGESPSLYETKDKILMEKKCLIHHGDPRRVQCLSIDILEYPAHDPDRCAGRWWMGITE